MPEAQLPGAAELGGDASAGLSEAERERHREYQRKWREANRERYNAYQRAYMKRRRAG